MNDSADRSPSTEATSSLDESGRPPQTVQPRPDAVPDKFWDTERGELRADALIKSYTELEKKLGGATSKDVPTSPADYLISSSHPLISNDVNINTRLHAAGFTQEQAQLLYDIGSERLLPMVASVASFFDAERQTERLIQHFGGEDRWQEASRQIADWGRRHLDKRAYEALSTTFEGVIAMHAMMTTKEPELVRDSSPASGAASEPHLRHLMRDPRYWRDQNPTLVQKVREGFKTLYPD